MVLALDDVYEPYLHTRLLAAGRAMASSPSASASEVVAVARQLFEVLVSTPVRPLAEAISETIAPFMQTSAHADLAGWALQAIAEKRHIERMGVFADDPDVLAALIRALDDSDDEVRISAARSLVGSAGHPAARDALLEQLTRHNWDARRAAARALRPALDDPVVDRALHDLLPDPAHADPDAVQGLGPLAAHSAVRDALLAALDSPDLITRHSAGWELEDCIGDPAVRTRLLDLLESADNDVRTTAAWILLDRGVDIVRAVDALAQVLRDEPDAGTRTQAVFALRRRVSDQYVRAPLIPATRDRDYGVRISAIEALEDVAAEPEVTEALLAALQDRHYAPRAYAAFALKPVAALPQVRDALIRASKDRYSQVREWATRSLGAAATEPGVAEALLARLSDPSGVARETALESLSGVATRPYVYEALMKRRDSRSLWLRSGVAKALGPHAADPEILDDLRPLLADPDDGIRRDATEALGPACGDPAVRQVVIGMLADPDDLMPVAVLYALAEAPRDRALVQPLGELTFNNDRWTAQEAYEILSRWHEQEAAG